MKWDRDLMMWWLVGEKNEIGSWNFGVKGVCWLGVREMIGVMVWGGMSVVLL